MSGAAGRRLRVVILRHADFPRDPRVRREAAALVARGHDVEVVCLRAAGQAARETVDGVAITRLPVRHRRASALRYVWEYGAFFALAAAACTWRHLRRPADVVQVNTMPDALVFAAAPARRMGARVVLDLHELMPELFASKFGAGAGHPWPRALARIETAAIRYADAAIAVSRPCRARYVARGAPEGKLTIVMNAADPALFSAAARAAGAAARRARAGGPLRVVGHGTLVRRHGFDLLIQAVAAVPGARLEILGDGDARAALARLAAGLGVAERVTLPGFVPLEEVPARVAGADVGVVPNRSDPFMDLVVPTKLMEYVALGVPAVAARTPAVEAYFAEDMVAYFAPGDVDALSATLAALRDDPARRAALARRADDGFQSRYGWPVMAERYVRLIESTAAGGAGAARGGRDRTRPRERRTS